MQLMRGREVNWGAMPLTGVFETSRRRAGAWSARSRPTRCATSARRSTCPTCRTIRASPTCSSRSSNKAELHAMFRERFDQHDRATGSRGWRRRTCCARRCARSARRCRRADRDQRHDPRGRRRRSNACASSARRSTCRQRAGRDPHARRRSWASTPTKCWRSSPALRREVASQPMPIRFEVADHVARVTIDRPEVMNAIDAATEARAAARSGQRSRRDATCASVVLTGAGERAFCAGADMKNGSGRVRPRLLGRRAARRLRRHRAARDARRAGDRARQRPRARRRLRDGARLRHRRRVPRRRASACPSRGRPPAARRRHDAAAAPDPVPPRDGHAAHRPAHQRPPTRWRSASSTRWCRAPNSTPRSIAGSPTSWAARRCRCTRSSRWCGAPPISAQEAQALRLPALVAALQSEDADEGVRAFVEKRKPIWRGE